MKSYFEKYLKLRDEIDNLSNSLFHLHHSHTKCKKGCASCCMDYSIFPIEFYYIKNQIAANKSLSGLKTEKDSDCIFLKNNECLIYEHRPIICRTHGLPLLFFNDQVEEWELSTCELNFTEFDEFDNENTFPQDTYNSKLFLLNEKFIKTIQNPIYQKFDLIPIKDLINRDRIIDTKTRN